LQQNIHGQSSDASVMIGNESRQKKVGFSGQDEEWRRVSLFVFLGMSV
jgi:hypothetical protein